MKILSLGLDASILDKNSALARRAIDYGNLVEEYTIIVPSVKKEKIELSEKVKVYGSGGGNKIMQFFNIYKTAKILLNKGAIKAITAQDQYYLSLLGLMLAEEFGVGLEIQVHGFEKYSGLRKIIVKYVLPRADAVRAVSQRLKKQLIDGFGVKSEKVTVVPIYSPMNGQQSAADKARDNGRFIFLTVGRLVLVKNITLQVKAMAEIIKKYPNAELWVAGDGPERKNLKKKIEKLKLSENVKLLGQKSREELRDIYGQADVFILTSDSEGWGLAVVEAASYGLPVIMTDVGCAGEVIKNGESGLVIPVGGGEILTEAMAELLADKALRQRFGDEARRAVAALPSKQETLNLYLASWQKAAMAKNT